MIQWIWDWAKYHNSHSSKSIGVTKLSFCQNDFPRSMYTILTKGQFGHSYTFWKKAIMTFSPVSNFVDQSLSVSLSEFLCYFTLSFSKEERWIAIYIEDRGWNVTLYFLTDCRGLLKLKFEILKIHLWHEFTTSYFNQK